MDQAVFMEIKNNVGLITLNRPKNFNAMNKDLVDNLHQILEQCDTNPSIKCVILTGAGKAFCAGGDLSYLESLKNSTEQKEFISSVGELAKKIWTLSKPVLAMVNGVAAGAGFNLALACDFIFADSKARFAQSFVNVGLIPDCGGLFFLPRIVGLAKAKELMFTGRLVDIDEAIQLGIVTKSFVSAELEQQTFVFADELAQAPIQSIKLMKQFLNTDNLTLNKILTLESIHQPACMATEDHLEGIIAFKEKRKPNFKK